jgi:hypothetical protein
MKETIYHNSEDTCDEIIDRCVIQVRKEKEAEQERIKQRHIERERKLEQFKKSQLNK